MSAAEITPRIRGLKAYLEDAARQLRDRPPDPAGEEEGAVLYFGNWHDSHPRALLFADELGPTDKLAWMVIQATSDPKAPARFPSYDEFGRAGLGSRPTIAAAIAMLRITRWISLCDRVRDGQGRYRGSVYAIHDEAVSVTEAMYLDPEYITYLESLTDHGHRRVRETAQQVLSTIQHRLDADRDLTDPVDTGGRFERRLATLSADPAVRAAASPSGRACGAQVKEANSGESQVKNLNSVADHRVKNLNSVDPPDENPSKTETSYQVKNLNSARARGGSSSLYKPTTTKPTSEVLEQPGARDSEETAAELHYPESFGADHRKLADRCLQGLPADQAQQVLDEVAGAIRDRAQTDPIRNPLRYLSAVAKRARSGEFLPSYAVDAAERRRRKAEQAERERRIDQASVQQAEAQVVTVEPDANNELVQRLEKARSRSTHRSKEPGA
ncbi:STY4528 family pathogenicity island replication protein [Thioalkalivibrio sp. ALE28]|uniref:STY4528 family pathogenicity island replication protein n=1 Tax=Thioalkalivibrio sp. ALE28 TaxID=1158179 RepID=UPI0003661857|nr:STY4528 family pathogenicity island replication protein [Thioalkalivibrio sp. ALE28]